MTKVLGIFGFLQFGVADILDRNKLPWTGTREELLAEGYLPCGLCRP